MLYELFWFSSLKSSSSTAIQTCCIDCIVQIQMSKERSALLSLCAALTFVLFLGYFWTMAFHHAAIREFIKISYCRYEAPLSVAAICSTRDWSDDYFMWLSQSSCLSGICSAVYPSSLPGCRIIVIIFRGGKKPLVHIVSSQVFARFSPSCQELSGCFCPVRAPSVHIETLVSKVWPDRGCGSRSQPVFPSMASFWEWRAASPLPLMYWNSHLHPPLHPAPPL